MWIKAPALTTNSFIQWRNGTTDGFNVYFHTGGNIFNQVFNAGSAILNFGVLYKHLQSKWMHIAITYVPNTYKVYINGVLKDTRTGFGTMGIATVASTTITVGGSGLRLKNFAFQNTLTPWTQTQITKLCRESVMPDGTNGFYKCEGDVLDSSGNGNNASTASSYTTDSPFPPRTTI